MSWEKMSVEPKPCPCGQGTITGRTEMDDWNRIRHFETINCKHCRAAARERQRKEQERGRKRQALRDKALHLAERRYLKKWMDQFSGKSKKAIWLLLTSGTGNPALGTFYSHVRTEGVKPYLRRHFASDFPQVLAGMGVDDAEIPALLLKRAEV